MNPFSQDQINFLIKFANQGVADEQDAARRQTEINQAQAALGQEIDPTAQAIIDAAPAIQTETTEVAPSAGVSST